MEKYILTELQKIPGVGKSIAADLYAIGIRSIKDLRDKDPEELYEKSNLIAGTQQDRCLLYVFRCAVYFAQTKKPDPKKLLWWYWKDHKKKTSAYYLYVLECADKTLYTGITTDVSRRISEHNKSALGAKYTASRRPVKLIFSQKFSDRSSASRAEAKIKKMDRKEKLQFISSLQHINVQSG